MRLIGINLCSLRATNGVGIEGYFYRVIARMPIFESCQIALPRELKIARHENIISVAKLPTPLRIIYEMLVLPLKFYSCQKVLSINNFGPLFGCKGQQRYIVIHDVWFLSEFYDGSRLNRWIFFLLIRLQLKFSHHVITVSEFSKGEISRYLNIQKSNIEVVPNCLDANNLKPSHNYQGKQKYFILIGSDRKNKNIKKAIKAYLKYISIEAKPNSLVVVGPYSEEFKKSLEYLLKNNNKITWRGYVSRETLNDLINQSSGLFFPSIYEGYGIPVIEAIDARKPILLCQDTACAEIAQGVSIAVDCQDIDEMAKGLQALQHSDTIKLADAYSQLDKIIHDCEGCAQKLQTILLGDNRPLQNNP